MFGSNLDSVIDFVRRAHFVSWSEDRLMAEYKRFFNLNGSFPDDFRANKLRKLWVEGQLRLGGGWTGAMRFDGDGVLVVATPGMGKGPAGPVEALGMRLERPKDPVPREEMEKKEVVYQEYFMKIWGV
jgi:hypothetical protein